MSKFISRLIVFLLLLTSCEKENNTIEFQPDYLTFEVPENFPQPSYDLSNNPLTTKGVELGKKLFYDGRLSVNNSVSCGSCHEQAFAFTHHEHVLSHGIDGLVGTRNTPPIQNMAFQKVFMWDGAVTHLDLLPILPITSEVEMGEEVLNVVQKLGSDETYRTLFIQAFEDGEVNVENMLKALSQFMVLMVSSNSRYDQYIRGDNGVQLTDAEQKGMKLFQSKCADCHNTDLFTDQTFRNNGLIPNPRLNDFGRFDILEREEDRYKFKVPSLRNIEVTNPYMHDGRFKSLEAVLDFYESGMVDNGTVDEVFDRKDGSLGIDMSEEEKEQIIAFLLTLTDEQYLKDERFAEF